MNDILRCLIAAAAGYVLGSVPFGLIVAKLYAGVDIRKHGSGNIGMTNVMRTIGWFPSALTFLGDTLKGVAAALIGQYIGGNTGLQIGGAAAILGHMYPFTLNFKGGKGISTSFGYILVANWRFALVAILVQLVVLLISGYMSLASICSTVIYMLCAMLSGNDAMAAVGIVMALLVIWSHRSNIKRLAKGHENKLDPAKITRISEKMVQKLKNRRKTK